ncbi:MAG: hypothetical protein MR357_09275, partial [Anaeroplasma sp.]|nr:hypothetical protein [Anaeroplasma sp.]
MKKIYENNIIKRIIPSFILGLMSLFTILSLFVIKSKNNSLFLNLLSSDSINVGNIILVVVLALEGIGLIVGTVLAIIKSKYYFPFF